MIYLMSLVAILAAVACASATSQTMFEDFIDLRVVERHVLLAFVAWSLGGWALEAHAATRLAVDYEACAATAQQRLDALWDDVFNLLGEV